MNAELLMLIGGVTAFGLTLFWVRNRQLSEKYALAWVSVATLLLLCGIFPRTVEGAAEAAHLSYPAAILLISLGIIYVFAFSVSVALSRLNRRSVRLLQHIAILEGRIRELERSGTALTVPGGSSRSPPIAEMNQRY